MDQKFYICGHCGNIIAMVEDKGVPVMCCGQKMQELVAGTTEASPEKHIPVYTEHPMLEAHYIQWISLQTNLGNQRKVLKPGDPPKAQFALLPGEEVEAVYAYCNLHSLWKG